MREYLETSRYIDWKNPLIQQKARELSVGLPLREQVAQACFNFVRDEIKHSWDYKMNPVTCAASDVLQYGTGYCYAKSHLLAALLRANAIPSGLCYQRLTIDDEQPPFCLHGLNAVYLKSCGWYRLDARGNNSKVNADFCPPREKLAFPIQIDGEADLPEIWAEPLPVIVHVLETSKNYQEVAEKLPDVLLLG